MRIPKSVTENLRLPGTTDTGQTRIPNLVVQDFLDSSLNFIQLGRSHDFYFLGTQVDLDSTARFAYQ